MVEYTNYPISLLEIDFDICNGYVVFHYENDDITISCELSEIGEEYVITGWDIQED